MFNLAPSPPHPGAVGPHLFDDACSSGVVLLAGQPLPDAVDRLLKAREALTDKAAEEVAAGLTKLADRIAAAIEASIGAGTPEQIRLHVLGVQLDDCLDILEGIVDEDGNPILAATQQAWVERLRELSALAEETAEAADIIKRDDARLDSEGYTAALTGQYQNEAAFWDTAVTRPLGNRVLRGLNGSLFGVSLKETAETIADETRLSIPQAYTEARTETAAFDRLVAAETAHAADPDGDRLVWLYVGPVDGLQRPFCAALISKDRMFWTRDQVGSLRNNQPGMPALLHGGGYNCRHQWVQMHRQTAERRGYRPATAADVAAAGIAAMSKRR